MRRVLLSLIIGLLFFIPATISPTDAQENIENTCAQLTTQMITSTLESCSDLPYDQACHNGAEGLPGDGLTFIPLEEAASFASPAFDAEDGTYGVGLLNTSAALPRTESGKGVMFLLLGDVQLENSVSVDDAFTPADPIPVTTLVSANLRTRPSTNDSVLDSVNADQELMADGLSSDREWLRVAVDGNPAWISRSLVSGEGLDDLPVIDPAQRALMQDFTLHTGSSEDCAETLDMLVIQALDAQPVSLSVNGAGMRIRGTVTLRNEERSYDAFVNDPEWYAEYLALVPDAEIDEDTLCQFTELSVLDGDAFLNNGLFSIPRGYRAFTFHCGEDTTDIRWNRSMPISFAQLQSLQVLADLPEGTLRRTIEVPSAQEIARITSQIASAGSPTNTTTDETTDTTDDAGNDVLASAECSGFVPTHPVDSIQFGWVRFYWDPAPDATSYQVNLYNYEDEYITSFSTRGPETSVRVSTMSPRFSIRTNRTPPMSYEVIAFKDWQPMCTTPRLYLLRDYDPDPDCPPSMWFTGECEDVIANDP